MKNPKLIYLPLAALLLALLACNLPLVATPTPTATPVGQAEGTPTGSPPTSTEPPATEAPNGARETPTTEPPEGDGCTFEGRLVTDVTIPDGTEIPRGNAFVKTWRLRNNGTCDWEAGTELVFASGEQMGGPDAVAVGPVEAGSNADISVDLAAPMTPGTYRGNWQLETPDGVRFGSVIYVEIEVPEPTPQPTDTSEPTEEPTPMPAGCVSPHPELEYILDVSQSSGYAIGCPTDESFALQGQANTGALQEFWANVDEENPRLHYRSMMIWRADTLQIYVIDSVYTPHASEGTLMVYDDTWDESQPETPPDCDEMTPPEGYQLPVRGFGKIWCEEELVDEIGWPDDGEWQVDLLIQPTENGLLMKAAGTYATYVLALMPDAGEAIATWPQPE